MPNLGDIAGILGPAFLGGAGKSGRAAATSRLNTRARLREDSAVRKMQELQDAEKARVEQMGKRFAMGVGMLEQDDGTDQKRTALAQEMIRSTGPELYGMREAEVEAFASSLKGSKLSSTEGSFSSPGTVVVDGVPLAAAVNSKGGLVYQEGPDKGKVVPGAVRGTFTSAKPQQPLVGDIKIDMTTATQSGLESKAISSSDALNRLAGIKNKFRGDFLTIGGKAKAAGLDIAEKVGIPISDANKKYLEEFTEFTVSSIRNINDYIKEVTGAQMSEFEAKRLRRGMPDAGDGIFGGMGATKFESTLNSTMRDLALVNARALIMRERGIEYDFNSEENKGKDGPITLTQTKEIIAQRGEEIMAGLLASGDLSKDEAAKEAKRLLWQEYEMQ